MHSLSPLSLILIAGYFVAIFGISLVFSKKIQNLSDYFLAGRSLGALPAAIALVAAGFGAGSTMGSVNAFHDEGISAVWQIALPYLLTCLVVTFFFARRVADQASLSIPEAVERHYGRLGRFLLTLILLATTTTFIGSQMVAAGKLFHGVLGLDAAQSVGLVTLIVLAYSVVGGYFAVVITDICQFVLYSAAILVLALFVMARGWWAPETLPTLAPTATFWNPLQNWLPNAFLALTFLLSWSIAPEMWQRMSSTRDRDQAFRASCISTACLMGLFTLVGLIGLGSADLVGASKTVMVDLAFLLPHEGLTALVLVGIAAAITSTMDSSVNIGSLTLTRDLYQGFLHPKAGTRELLWVSRIASVLIVLPAIVIALRYEDIIHVLWISSDIYAATMFFPVVGLLYCRRPGRLGGVLAMILGGAATVFSALTQHHWITPPFPWPGWPYSTLVGVGLSGIGFGLGYWLERRHTGAETPRAASPTEMVAKS